MTAAAHLRARRGPPGATRAAGGARGRPTSRPSSLAVHRPVTTRWKDSSMSTHPAPPASTTPARASASSWSGVRARASWAASTAASHTSASEPPASAASTAAAAPASATVRMVPSCGWATQARAAAAPLANASASSSASSDSLPRSITDSHRPPTSWLTMTPELPRAARRMARLRVRHSSTSVAAPRMPAASCDGHDLVDRRVEGEVEVGAGVAVGHREDVEGVDLGAPCSEGRPREQRPVSGVGGGELGGHGPHINGPLRLAPAGVLVRRARLGYACPVACLPLRAAERPLTPHP